MASLFSPRPRRIPTAGWMSPFSSSRCTKASPTFFCESPPPTALRASSIQSDDVIDSLPTRDAARSALRSPSHLLSSTADALPGSCCASSYRSRSTTGPSQPKMVRSISCRRKSTVRGPSG